MRRLAMSVLVMGLALAMQPTTAQAATFVVNSTTDVVDAAPGDGTCATAAATCTLRAAVQEANALAGADAVTLPAGTFLLTLVGPGEDAAATGDLDVTQALAITGAGRDATIIDGIASDRVFASNGAEPFALTGLTVRNGQIADPGGGVVHLGAASLTLTDVAFRNNRGTTGGGVAVSGGPLTIVGGVFDDNLASSHAGAVAFSGGGAAGFEVRDTTFLRNTAANGIGGAIRSAGAGPVVVASCRFLANSGETGGAVSLVTNSTASITDSLFEDSRALNATPAGAAYVEAETIEVRDTIVRRSLSEADFGGMQLDANSGATVTGSTFEDNQAFGVAGFGGLAVIGGTGAVVVEDTTIAGNRALTGIAAGLLVTTAGPATLTRVTVDDNQSGSTGGGAYVSAGGALTIAASRFTRNTAAASAGGGLVGTSTAGNVAVADTTISDNAVLAGVAGGGYLTAATTLSIERSTIANNLALGAATVGGGLFVGSPTTAVELRNSTVSGNLSQFQGGGVFVTGMGLTVVNTTFHGNEALSAGAAVFAGSPLTFRASAIGATATASCGGVAPTSADDNVDQDGSCALAGARDRSGIDPQLGPLQDNGGPTHTHEPLAGSPLIDGVGGGDCPATDQRSVARPTDGNGDGTAACDVGAVEFVDECPTDPAKRLPGVCGCGVPDDDANANGAVDCLINAELKARITASRTVLDGLTGDDTDAQTAARAELTALADGLLSYCTANATTIVVTSPKPKLLKVAKKARKALRAARKGKGAALAKKQVRGRKALDALDALVAPQA